MSTTPGAKKQNITETKAYGVAQSNETLDLEKFAKHITDHGCAYDRAYIRAVITKAVDCHHNHFEHGQRPTLIQKNLPYLFAGKGEFSHLCNAEAKNNA